MRADRLLLAASVAIAVAAASADARAYCRTTTVASPPDFEPSSSQCFTSGVPVYHPSQCVGYRLLAKESPVITNAVLSDALRRAFGTWAAPNDACTPGISAVELPPVDRTVIAHYETGGSNENIVGVVTGAWPHGDGNTLALTTLTFRAETGVILDADTEISSQVKWTSTKDVPADAFDVGTALAHEAGHFLGLSHTADAKAVMFAAYTPGTSRQKLDNDDILGICAIYPSTGTRVAASGVVASTPCDLSPSSSTCGDPKITHGCATSPDGGAPGIGGLALAALAGLIVARRRTR